MDLRKIAIVELCVSSLILAGCGRSDEIDRLKSENAKLKETIANSSNQLLQAQVFEAGQKPGGLTTPSEASNGIQTIPTASLRWNTRPLHFTDPTGKYEIVLIGVRTGTAGFEDGIVRFKDDIAESEKSGMTLYFFEIEFVNHDDERLSVSFNSFNHISLLDDLGMVNDRIIKGGDKKILDGILEPGDKKGGYIIFEIPRERKPTALRFTTRYKNSSTGEPLYATLVLPQMAPLAEANH